MAGRKSAFNTRILVVDDDRLVRDFIVHTIEYGLNSKVETSCSGLQAWHQIQDQPAQVDLIISDANIPEMDGFELLKSIKQDYPDKICILMAGNAKLENQARQLGADGFICKPFQAEDLFTVINQFIFGVRGETAKEA